MARYEIEVLPWAIDDVREAYLYLLERDERLADEFQRRVSEALRALAETAHHYQAREDSIRRWPLKKWRPGSSTTSSNCSPVSTSVLVRVAVADGAARDGRSFQKPGCRFGCATA